MGDRMTCPGCEAHTSGVLFAYREGKPCPYCGLSANAMEEILAARTRHADQVLTEQVTAALKRIDVLERENRSMRAKLNNIKYALESDDE